MTPRTGRHALLALAAVLAPVWAEAVVLKGAPLGRMVDAPDGQSQMEQLSLDVAVAPTLLGVPLEGNIRVEEWPVAPGVRRTVVVARHDVYAPDAKIVAIDGGNEIEIPRSKLVFLWGTAEGDGATSVLITVDPDTAAVWGSSTTPDGSFDLLAPVAGRVSSLLAGADALRKPDPGVEAFGCGLDQLPKEPALASLHGRGAGGPVPQVLSSLHSAVLAVDTDNEFMSVKFGDNTTTATNYIAQVFAGITAIYERDLFVRLLQGYTVLRVSATADPYLQPVSSPPSPAQLNEVGAYWSANYGGVKRALVMMLSGKQPTANSGSGIAALSRLCSTTGGYSFTQVFPNGTTAGFYDFSLIGHEVGHNFGAPHTHCTDTSATAGIQPIDFCYSAECGASWNPASAQVCPTAFTITPANGAPITNVRGTLMSYCHVGGVCPSPPYPITNVFHPQSISVAVGPAVDNAVGVCIFPIVGNPAPTVTSISPVSGLSTGGTAVTITGTNFRTPAAVAFGDLGAGKAATGVVVVNPTTITATTPAHSAGLKDVVVMNPDQQTGTLKNGYTYVAAVTATGISPNSGTTAGGTPVTITGTSFVAPATVTLGGTAATAVSVVNPATITATTPAHAAGTVNVVVQSNAQTGTLTNGYFYFTPAPPGKFYTLSPCRLVDTRGAVALLGGPALAASGRRNFTLTSTCGVPTTAKAISVNLTVTGATAPGFVSLFPGDGIAPATSNINFATGQTRANNAVVLLATNGSGSLAVLNGAAGTVHFILDVNGYFQ
jgi:IPT/TIG domain/Metallo-peptidase family M12